MSKQIAAQRYEWMDEGAHPVAPGVYRIPLPLPTDGLRAVNVYAIEADSGLVLIDSGWALAGARDRLERSLGAIGAGLPDVRKFLVTHLHRDHYTQAIEVRRLLGTPVALGADEKHSIDKLLGPGYQPLGTQLAVLREAGAGPLAEQLAARSAVDVTGGGDSEAAARQAEELARSAASELTGTGGASSRPTVSLAGVFGYESPDEWILPGQLFELGTRTLEAVPTPGHTRGHVVFADTAAGLLFAGDHVLPHITPSIGFEEAPADLPLGDYLQSLNAVRRLPDMRLLPAHGPVSPSTHARIDELVDHHAARLGAIADLLAGANRTGYAIAADLPWTSRQRKLADLDLMNQMLAVCETVYHLDLLVARHAACSQLGEDGVRRYRLLCVSPD
jgi:glyoxylase-like metal-dependent hydrolase (beta-lactamase superfamily II)